MFFRAEFQKLQDNGVFLTTSKTNEYECRERLVTKYRDIAVKAPTVNYFGLLRVIVATDSQIPENGFINIRHFMASIVRNKYRKIYLERDQKSVYITFNFKPSGCLVSFMVYILRNYNSMENGWTIDDVVDLMMKGKKHERIALSIYGTMILVKGPPAHCFVIHKENGPANCVAFNIRNFKREFDIAIKNEAFFLEAKKVNTNSYAPYWPVENIAKALANNADGSW